jgi:ribonuclease HI
VIIIENEGGESDQWTLYFDGAINASGNGARAVAISPENKQYPFSTRLLFECTNNTAEYEA